MRHSEAGHKMDRRGNSTNWMKYLVCFWVLMTHEL